MNDSRDAMTSAWRAASADLDIEVTAPFHLDDSSSTCIAWIAAFGSAQGTLVDVLGSRDDAVRSYAEARDMYYSELSEAAYTRYDRASFVDTLNDWGWQGDFANAPEWYSRQPRTT